MRLSPQTFIIAVVGALMAGLAGCSATPGGAYGAQAANHAAVTRAPSHRALASPKPTPSPSPSLTVAGATSGVKARSGILVDAKSGQVLWSKGADAERPMASITKVMTAYLVIKAGNLDTPIKVPGGAQNYVAKYGAEGAGLVSGQELTPRELLNALMLQSGADAAYTFAVDDGPGLSAFVAKMNAEAKQLGMTHTHFASPDGLPYPTETSTFSTPADLIKLGQAAMQSSVFRSTVDQVNYNLAKGAGHKAYSWHNDDSLLQTYSGAVGIKTGFTDDAGHCLLFEAVRNGRTLMGVVLDSPATGIFASEEDATRILNWGFGLKTTG
jgi:D-alanyl-D-alanine carboxypeptidase (penicillin-binding protein 5/6)